MRTLAILPVLALVACGGGDKEPTKTAPPVVLSGTVNDHGTKDADGTKAGIELDDFYFGPTFVKAAPGATLTLELENEGSVAHTFTTDTGVDVTVAPGTKGTGTVTLPASGAVRFYCRFHAGQGMQGAFFSKAGDTVAPGSAPSASGDGGDGAYNQ
jgi:plastocyanin